MTEKANEIVINVEQRIETGKIPMKMLRKSGKVPGVIYTIDKKNTKMFSIERMAIEKLITDCAFMTRLFTINLNGEKLLVMPREVQFDPVIDNVNHIDFMEVKVGQKLRKAARVLYLLIMMIFCLIKPVKS